MKRLLKKLNFILRVAYVRGRRIFVRRDEEVITFNYYGRQVEFDKAYYRDRYSDVGGTTADAFGHFVVFGALEGRYPNSVEEVRSMVDEDYYLEVYPDVAAGGFDPADHFWAYGTQERRNPNLFFDTAYYLKNHPAAADSGLNPLMHYARWGRTVGYNPSPWFDHNYYSKQYADVLHGHPIALWHFIHKGVQEHRSPLRQFNSEFYLAEYPDVLESGIGAFEHFVRIGAKRGHNPSPEFDAEFYDAHFLDADAREEGLTPQYHFLTEGLAAKHPVRPPYPKRDFLPATAPTVTTKDVKPPLVVLLPEGVPSVTESCIEHLKAARCQNDAVIVTLGSGEQAAYWAAQLQDVVAQYSDRDAVVINPRCRIGDGWLDRLISHAYSSLDIASVTPFTTFVDSEAPNTVDTKLALTGLFGGDHSGYLLSNAGRSADLPMPGSLCTYIRRDALESAGGLSCDTAAVAHFADVARIFASRLAATGWRHVLAGDVLLPDAQPERAAETGAVPAEHRSPELSNEDEFDVRMRRFATADPAMPLRFSAFAERYRTSGQPVILIVTHSLGGGTQRYIEELTEYFSGQAHFLVMNPLYGNSWAPQANRQVVLRSAATGEDYELIIDVFEAYEHLLDILRACGVSKVSLQHFLYVPLDLKRLIEDLRVPFEFTAHDYFSICPYVILTTSEATYCGEPDTRQCTRCIASRMGHGARDILWWRKSFEWLFRHADRVICPSQDTANRLARYFDGAAFQAVSHTSLTPGLELRQEIKVPPLTAGEPLRIAVLGTLARHKGADVVAACARLARRHDHAVEFHIVGAAQVAMPLAPEAPLFETGAYQEGEAGKILATVKPHLVWFPAQCPETHSYTLSEAMAAGLPVVVPDLGSFAERLEGRPWTWSLGWNTSPEDAVAFFDRIRREHFLPAAGPPVRGEGRSEVSDFYSDEYLSSKRWDHPIDLRNSDKLTIVAVLQKAPTSSPGVIVESPDACGYIRGLLPLKDLAATGEVDYIVVEEDRVSDYIADIFFTQRTAVGSDEQAKRIIEHCRTVGMRIVYDIDDDLFSLEEDHSEHDTYKQKLAGAFQFASQADQVFASTPQLKAQLDKWNDNIVVVENALDGGVWDLDAAQPILSNGTRSDPVRIVYMGTMTHGSDFRLIEGAVRRLSEELGKRVAFEVVGVALRDDLPDWCKSVDVPLEVAESYPSFVQWLEANNRWHIGVAPLVDTKFNRAKSGIKYLDYAALGLAVVCSDIQGYRDVIASEEDGLLVENTEDAWYDALHRLVRDNGLRHRLQKNAMQNLREKHLLSGNLAKRLSSLKALSRWVGETVIGPAAPWKRFAETEPTRENIAGRFLQGQGIEIGALHNPLAVPAGVSVKYVDRMPKAQLYEHYPELRAHELVDVDLIDDGETLATIPEGSQHFVIANHFLEHCQDPLGTLRNLTRVLAAGGVLYAAVPDRRYTFDKNRTRTQLDHLIVDFETGPSASRREHFLEWVRFVEPEFGRQYGTEEEVQARADALEEMDYSIHFHVWEPEDVWEFLSYGIERLNLPVEIEYFGELADEILFILRRL